MCEWVCANLIVDKTLEKLFTWVIRSAFWFAISIHLCCLVLGWIHLLSRFWQVRCTIKSSILLLLEFYTLYATALPRQLPTPSASVSPCLVLLLILILIPIVCRINCLSQAKAASVELTITQGQGQQKRRVKNCGSRQAAYGGTIAARLGAGHHLGVFGANVLAVGGDDKLKYIANLRGWGREVRKADVEFEQRKVAQYQD